MGSYYKKVNKISMKAAVNNLNSQYNASVCTSKPQSFDEHRLSGTEFRGQANMDPSNSGPFNSQRQDLVATFKNDNSRSNMKMKNMSSQGTNALGNAGAQMVGNFSSINSNQPFSFKATLDQIEEDILQLA